MVLETEIVKTSEGEVKISKISFAGQMRIDALGDKKTTLDIINECIDNSEVLDKIDTKEGVKVLQVVNKVNGWSNKKKPEEAELDFQETHSKKESGK